MVYLTFGQILLYAKFVLGTLEEVPHEVTAWLPCGLFLRKWISPRAHARGLFLRKVREVFGTYP